MPCVDAPQHRGRRGHSALSHVLLLLPLVAGISRCFCGNFAWPTSSQRLPGTAWRGRADQPRAIVRASEDDDDDYVPAPSYIPVETLAVGQKYEGVVMKVTSNGAYVDVGSTVEAFLPFRSMTRRKGEANSPADLVKEGDGITVYIQSVDGQNVRVHKFLDRISVVLGRNCESAELMQDKVGETLTGIVNSIHSFGIFVAFEAPSGGKRVLGLMPGSIIRGRPQNFASMLGKEVEAAIESVTAPEKEGQNWRMAIRVPDIEGTSDAKRPARQAQPVTNADLVSAEVMQEKVGETVPGVINSIQTFGIFVALKVPNGDKYVQGLMPRSFINGDPGKYADMVGKEVEALVDSVTEPEEEGKIWRMSVRVSEIARSSSPRRGGNRQEQAVASEKLVSAEVMQEKVGETVPGVINSIQKFGVFVALKAPTGDKYVQGLMPGRFIEGEPSNYASMVGKEVEALVESVEAPEEEGLIWRMSVRVPDMLRKTPA